MYFVCTNFTHASIPVIKYSNRIDKRVSDFKNLNSKISLNSLYYNFTVMKRKFGLPERNNIANPRIVDETLKLLLITHAKETS